MPTHESIGAAVAHVQRTVSVPKSRDNEFGKFSYRSYEDIVAALKGPCAEAGIAFTLTDTPAQIGERYYIKATAEAFFDDGREGTMKTAGWAREAERKTGSDDAQVTGMASSYARKYALCGLFAIDADDDADAVAASAKQAAPVCPFTAHCRSCVTRYRFPTAAEYEVFKAQAACCPAPSWEVE